MLLQYIVRGPGICQQSPSSPTPPPHPLRPSLYPSQHSRSLRTTEVSNRTCVQDMTFISFQLSCAVVGFRVYACGRWEVRHNKESIADQSPKGGLWIFDAGAAPTCDLEVAMVMPVVLPVMDSSGARTEECRPLCVRGRRRGQGWIFSAWPRPDLTAAAACTEVHLRGSRSIPCVLV